MPPRKWGRPWASGSAVLASSLLLAGCSGISSFNPANWWHQQEGGKIAEQRPAPPGADEPFPNLSTVPPKPAVPDAAALKNLTDSLVADRTNAQHAAQQVPLADPSQPSTSPALFGVGSLPPPPPGSASASLPAVTAPPAPPSAPPPAPAASNEPPAAPAAAPRKPVQSAALEPPPPPAAAPAPAPAPPAPTPPTAIARANPPPEAPAAPPPATQPALPTAPPPRPAGAPVMAAAAAPPPMPAPKAAASADIVFVAGDSALSSPAADEVKAFAAKRGNGVIIVTGYGDAAAAADPAAQSNALSLALARAQAIADALKADGVPPAAVRVGAEASGRGAALSLLQ